MKTIVVLGVGLAAAPFIRQTMKSTVLKSKDYKMIVVNPSDQFLWPIAMPRAIVPGQFADEKVLYELEPSFKDYPPDKFESIMGAASSLNPEANQVTVSLPSGGQRQIAYDVLIVATGASANEDMPWKMMDTSKHTIERLHSLQKEIQSAKTIAIAGGGATGVETAGELGYEYSRTGAKKVYLIHNAGLPLSSPVIESVRKQAQVELKKLNVNIIANTKVTGASKSGKDTILQLKDADGKTTTLTVQAYIPTMGVKPNTSFMPESMLDARGFVKQTGSLQTDKYPNIFVIGDAGNLEANKAIVADAQAQYLIEALPKYLSGDQLWQYKVSAKEINAITLGRSKGTGHMGGFKIFGWIIWYMKGRFLGTDYAGNLAAGNQTLSKKFDA